MFLVKNLNLHNFCPEKFSGPHLSCNCILMISDNMQGATLLFDIFINEAPLEFTALQENHARISQIIINN